MKIVRIQQSAVHVGATAYLAREERAVDAARLVVVVNGGIKDLASRQTRSATRTEHAHAAATEPRLPTAVPASHGLAGAARSRACFTCACAALATLMLRPSAAAAAMLAPQANQDRRGSTAPGMLLILAAPTPEPRVPLLLVSHRRVAPGPANCRALLPNDLFYHNDCWTFFVTIPFLFLKPARPLRRRLCPNAAVHGGPRSARRRSRHTGRTLRGRALRLRQWGQTRSRARASVRCRLRRREFRAPASALCGSPAEASVPTAAPRAAPRPGAGQELPAGLPLGDLGRGRRGPQQHTRYCPPSCRLRTDAVPTARAVHNEGSGCIVLRSNLCRGARGAGGRADLLEGPAQSGPLHLRGSSPFCSGSVLLPYGTSSGGGVSAGLPALASSLPLRGAFPLWETEGAGAGLVLDEQQPGADQRSRLADARGTHEDLDLKGAHGALAKRRGDKKGGSRSASQVSSLDARSSPNTKRAPSSGSTEKDPSVGENGVRG